MFPVSVAVTTETGNKARTRQGGCPGCLVCACGRHARYGQLDNRLGGQPPDWNTFLADYRAAVDLPASAFWRELAAHNPDAVIVLSVRDSAEQWWDIWSNTIVAAATRKPPPGSLLADYAAMAADMLRTRLGATNPATNPADKAEMMAAYERHNDAVRAEAPPARLLEWRATDGWAPLAERLGVPVPDEPFLRANTRAQFSVPEFGTMPEWAQER